MPYKKDQTFLVLYLQLIINILIKRGNVYICDYTYCFYFLV